MGITSVGKSGFRNGPVTSSLFLGRNRFPRRAISSPRATYGEEQMNPFSRHSRRQFLTRNVSAAAVSLIAAPAALEPLRLATAAEPTSAPREMQMKLSFMTFVCPGWTTEKIVKFAKETGYDGVEIRVDAGHKHGISAKSSQEARRQVRKLFADEGVELASVATSVHFANPHPQVHKAQLEAAKIHLDLAAALGAPVVRIFAGGGIPKLTPEAARQVAAAFDQVGEYAKGSGSCPILECGHDIIKGATEAGEVIRQVRARNFGALWNSSMMDDATFTALKDRIRHFHLHDEVLRPDNTNLLELAKRLKGIGYRGFASLEIIKGKDLPEDLLKETAQRLKRQIAEGSK
jgi:sugar phosphate isomerase/epimerase